MELDKAVEFAQAIWPVPRVVVPALFALGWISPTFPHRGDNEVVERANKLSGQILHAKELGHKSKLSDKINLTILNITRGAFIHQAMYHARFDAAVKKYRNERGK
ncbi:MAG: hypothetical protein AAB788_03145 [Patescibacteria group bacterium]